MVPGQGRRRPAPASAIHEWSGFHDVLLRMMVDHPVLPRRLVIRPSYAGVPRARFSRNARASSRCQLVLTSARSMVLAMGSSDCGSPEIARSWARRVP